MSSEERQKSGSNPDARSSISSTIHDIAVDVSRDINVDEVQKKYAAAQVAAAQANSRFTTANRKLSELGFELANQTAVLQTQENSLARLSAENTQLNGELISLRGKLLRLSTEAKLLRDNSERTSNVSTQASKELKSAREEIAHLQQLLQEKDAEFQAVVHSFAFRIGRKITGLLRRIPGI